MGRAYKLYSDISYARAKRRALANPRYAELDTAFDRAGRSVSSAPDADFTWDQFNEYLTLYGEINPDSTIKRLHRWLEHHGWKAQLRVACYRQQRADRGFSDMDVWGLHQWLATVIAGSVDELRRIQYGYPGSITPEEWDVVLEKIARGFRGSVEIEGQLQDDSPHAREQLDEAFDLLKQWFFDLWD